MTTANYYVITDGPGKFDLMLALFEGKHVQFKIQGNPFLKVQINSVGAEDGSRESWLIAGGILEDIAGTPVEGGWRNFKGYFQIRRRQGWIEF